MRPQNVCCAERNSPSSCLRCEYILVFFKKSLAEISFAPPAPPLPPNRPPPPASQPPPQGDWIMHLRGESNTNISFWKKKQRSLEITILYSANVVKLKLLGIRIRFAWLGSGKKQKPDFIVFREKCESLKLQDWDVDFESITLYCSFLFNQKVLVRVLLYIY